MTLTRRVLASALVAVAYAAAVQLTFRTSLPSGSIAFWPPAGVAAVLLLLGGRDLWPGVLVGAYLAKVSRDGAWATIPGAIGPAIEGYLAAYALQRLRRAHRRPVEDLRALGLLPAGAAVSGLFGASALWVQGVLPGPDLLTGFARWAMGDLLGLLPALAVVLPAFLTHRRVAPRALAEGTLAGAVTAAVAWVLFHNGDAQLWPLMLPGVWIVLRCGLRTALTTSLAIATIAVWATVRHHGPLADGSESALLGAQLFALAFASVLLMLTAMTEERRHISNDHRRMRDEHAALRRVATAVAADTTPAVLATLVSAEVAALLDVETVAVMVFEDDGRAVRHLGRFAADHVDVEIPGDPVPVHPDGVVARVRDGGLPARLDERGADGTILPPFVQRVAAPVTVHGALWGVVIANTAGHGDLPFDAEERLGRFAELVGLAIDNAEAHEKLLGQATTDPLTGLLNHRTFHERLKDETAAARRHGRPLSLAVFDLDRFKQVNDTLGHLAGDAMLAEAARRMLGAARAGESVARVGGDELAVLMPGTSAADAHAAAERIRRAATAEPFDGVGPATISAGVCDLDLAGGAEQLLRLADGALYWAKAHGRDACIQYHPEVVEELSAAERADRLEHARALAALGALAKAIDAKDPATIRHSERVADLAAALAESCDWDPVQVRRLHDAALVHDVGKIGVPDAILSAPRRLTEDEYVVVKRHADLGARIVAGVLDPDQVTWVRGHHERHDGGGYPDALAAGDIAEGARLLALADAWDAMTGARTYSAPMAVAEALAEVRRTAGAQFHPDAVAALEAVHAAGGLDVDAAGLAAVPATA